MGSLSRPYYTHGLACKEGGISVSEKVMYEHQQLILRQLMTHLKEDLPPGGRNSACVVHPLFPKQKHDT